MERKRLSPARMATVLTALQILTAASAYVVNILSSRTLGAEGRGVLVLALQLTYFAAVFVVLGIERPFMAAVRLPFDEGLRAFSSFMRPGVALSFAVFAASIVLAVAGTRELALIGAIMSAYILLNGLGKGVRVAAVSSGQARALVAYTIATQGGMIALAALLSWNKVESATMWFLAYCVAWLPTVVILLVARHRSRSVSLSEQEFKRIRSQGLRLLPASVGNTAMVRSDRLILPVFAGLSALGIYSAVSTVMEMAGWPISQWADASLGRWKREGSRFSRRTLLRLSVQAVLAATAFTFLVAGGAYVSIIWFLPPEFRASVPLIVPLGVSSIVYSLTRVQQGALVVVDRGGTVSVIELLGMGVSVLGYFVFIPTLGVVGAPLGAIAGYATSALVGAFALYSHPLGSGENEDA